MHPETIVNFEVKKFLTRVNRSCKVDVTFNRPLRDEDEDDVMVLVSSKGVLNCLKNLVHTPAKFVPIVSMQRRLTLKR